VGFAARGDESLSPVEVSSLVNENLISGENEHRSAIRITAGLNKIRVRSSQQAEGRILDVEVILTKATRRKSASSWAVCYSFSGIHFIVNGIRPVSIYDTRRIYYVEVSWSLLITYQFITKGLRDFYA